ncbi:hypothetical protein G5B30_02765 [Sphingobacterium sp. SGG-5]|nr:hypothetical protein [Sphingobacterium sp. SGG-5]NGM60833.1 hypothetical protein [Sphingobacterium sp. SGG-5]
MIHKLAAVPRCYNGSASSCNPHLATASAGIRVCAGGRGADATLAAF